MTEQEWLMATDPHDMLLFLRQSERKSRLFAAACCRHFWASLPDERSLRAIEVGERYADEPATKKERKGKTTKRELTAAHHAAHDWLWDERSSFSEPIFFAALAASNVAHPYPHSAAFSASRNAGFSAREGSERSVEDTRRVWLLRDIFGNPFRPVVFDPSWLTPTVTSLAAAVYEVRHLPSGLFDNARLGILADALEEAGCDNRDVLGHLRSGGEHVRGCHVIDLILGKE